jgi:PilZ domain
MTYSSERRHQRISIGVPVEMRSPTETFIRRAQTANLSFGGCYIEMLQTLEAQARIDVVLWINNEKVHAWAEVVTNHTGIGNGVKFVHMLREDQEKLKSFVDSMVGKKQYFCSQSAASNRVNTARSQ